MSVVCCTGTNLNMQNRAQSTNQSIRNRLVNCMFCWSLHLGIILVNDQLDAQFFFRICLFQISACFEHSCDHHLENQFYQYNIWYMSLCVGDRLVCIPAYQTVTYIEWHSITDVVLIQLILLTMSTWVLETCRDLEQIYTKKELCVKLVTYKNWCAFVIHDNSL